MADGRIVIETGLDTSDVKRDVQTINEQLGRIGSNMPKVAKGMTDDMGNRYDTLGRRIRTVYKGTSAEARAMTDEIRGAFMDQRSSMLDTMDDMIKVRYGYFKMAQESKNYTGTTEQFMDGIKNMGKAHKTVTDNMMKQNELQKMSFYQTVGTMLNRSTQASKISENFDRMNNPLYKVNKAGLAVADSLNKIALQGSPAALALKMLGPTANMKQLNDMTRMISQGLMRFTAVALIAAAGAALFYSKIFKEAMGPDPAEVKSKQDALTQVYKDAYDQRVDDLMSFAGLFEEVTLESVDPASLTKALDSQVTAMETWTTNMADLAKRGVDEGLIKELQKIGPEGAAQVQALNSMTDDELNNYVSLWQEKMSLARTQAGTELEGLKAETDAKIKALQDSLTPLGIAVEAMKNSWVGAFTPMIELFGQIMTPVINFIGYIGTLINKFNEAHPTMAKLVSGFVLLIPMLTLILSPLAIGIGLFGGMQAAMGAVWMIIGPIVTGFATMMGTVLLVAAAIVGLVAGFIWLWKNSETFKNGVIAGWNAIKAAAIAVFNYLKPYIMQAITAVKTTIMQFLTGVQAFWAEHGAQIMTLVQQYILFVKTYITMQINIVVAVLKAAWNIIVSVIQVAWQLIVDVVTIAINLVKNIITIVLAVLRGDWQAAWEGIKQLAFDVWNGILNLITNFITGVQNVVRTVLTSIKDLFISIWNAIKSAVSSIIQGMSSNVKTKISDMKTTAVNLFNLLKAGAIKILADMVTGAIEKVVSIKEGIQEGIQDALDFVIGLASDFYDAGASLVNMIADGISSAIGAVTGAIETVVGEVRDYLPWSPAKTGPLKDLDTLDFAGPMADSILGGKTQVEYAMNKLLNNNMVRSFRQAMPATSSPVTNNSNAQVTLNYYGSGGQEDANNMVRVLDRQLARRTEVNNFMKGGRK